MFKLCILALYASFAAALQINPLIGATSQGPATVSWTNEAADTSRFAGFSVFLHHPTFRNDFAILNNVRPADGSENVTLPVVPAQDGYTLRATNVGNISDVFAESAPFAIGPEVSSSTTSTTSASSSSSLSVATTSGTGSGTTLGSLPSTTSPFGTTLANTNAGAVGGSITSTGTTSANTATNTLTNFNAAPRLGLDFNVGTLFVVALSAILGGAVVAA